MRSHRKIPFLFDEIKDDFVKVLHVVERFSGFGVSQQLAMVFNSFNQSRVEHSICTMQGSNAGIGVDDFAFQNDKVFSLDLRSSLNLSAAYRWIKMLRSISPTIVHFWIDRPPFWMAKICSAMQIKTFLSSDNRMSLSFADTLRNRFWGQNVDQFFLPREFASDQNEKYESFKHAKAIIAKAVDQTIQPDSMSRQRFLGSIGCNSQNRIITCVANLEPSTRIKDPIWATDLLKCIRNDVHLVVIGEGHQKARLKKFAAQASVGKYVHFLGERADAQQIVANADLYWGCDPTQMLPDGVLWAITAGVPVIASDSENHKQIITDRENGILVRTGARDAYARQANFVLNNRQQFDEMRKNAKQAAKNWPAVTSIARQFELYYANPQRSGAAA